MLLAVPERHLERVMWSPRAGFDPAASPFTIPAVRQLIDEGGFDVPPGVTVAGVPAAALARAARSS